jgi:hypothetical protein
VSLIGHTTTRSGLHIEAELDKNKYETGIEVTDEELATVHLESEEFHGEWNYTLHSAHFFRDFRRISLPSLSSDPA